MRTVPPEKSTPIGRPPRAIVIARPATMIAAESAIACQRQRRKLKLVFVKICIRVRLDTQLRLGTPRQRQLEQRARDEDGGEHVRQQAKEQRGRETPNWAGAELEEERRRDERGDVRIQ